MNGTGLWKTQSLALIFFKLMSSPFNGVQAKPSNFFLSPHILFIILRKKKVLTGILTSEQMEIVCRHG